MNFQDYIQFLEDFFSLVGETEKTQNIITGDRFLL